VAGEFTDGELAQIVTAMYDLENACGVDFYEREPGDHVLRIEKASGGRQGGRSSLGYCTNPNIRLVNTD
jgi:hypothetical protein